VEKTAEKSLCNMAIEPPYISLRYVKII